MSSEHLGSSEPVRDTAVDKARQRRAHLLDAAGAVELAVEHETTQVEAGAIVHMIDNDEPV
jgi:hypothetical protein